jgi:hypothetical protein
MSAQLDSAQTHEQAARISLLVLNANAKALAPPQGYIVLPSQKTISLAEATRVLSHHEKPLECEARLDGTSLVVQCHTMDDPKRQNHQLRAANRLVQWEPLVKGSCGEPIEDANLLFRSKTDSVIAPFRALRAWFRDYYVPYLFGDGTPNANPPSGVCMVVDVEAATDRTIQVVR